MTRTKYVTTIAVHQNLSNARGAAKLSSLLSESVDRDRALKGEA